MGKSTSFVSQPGISICTLVKSTTLAEQIDHILESNRYSWSNLRSQNDFLTLVENKKHQIDCLILQETSDLPSVVHELHLGATLLPSIILEPDSQTSDQSDLEEGSADALTIRPSVSQAIYHKAEVHLPVCEIKYLSAAVSQAINQFMKLSKIYRSAPVEPVNTQSESNTLPPVRSNAQRQSLSQKLDERLGYFGIFSKRNSSHFYKNLTETDQQELLRELRIRYRDIISIYFNEDSTVNHQIDMFANMAFFADLPTAKVIEIHMDLMDAFEKELIVQGRNVDFLLGYRLALIDTIAHLCEMYRRSILREA